MNKEKSIFTILILGLIALMVFGARTYYGNYGHHMMGGMHGRPYIEEREDYRTYGHDMMGPGMMDLGYGMIGAGTGCYMTGGAGVTDYYLYKKDALNLSKNQIETLERLKNGYYEENLALRKNLFEKNYELERLLSEKDIDLSKVKALTNEIGKVNAELKYNVIESFTKARNVLNEEQSNELNTKTFNGYMR